MPAFAFVGLIATASLVGVIRTSIRPGLLGENGFSIDAWWRVLADTAFFEAIGFTLWIAAASTVLAITVAIPASLALRRVGPTSRSVLALPVAAPHLVVATLAALWLVPGGLLDRLVGELPLSLTGDRRGLGIIIVYVWKEIPFLTILALAALDPATRELEHSAALLGAGPLRRLRDVVLPRLLVPLAGGGMLIAAFVIGAVEVPLVVGPTSPDMLGTYALGVIRLDGPAARADAAVANVVAAALVGALGAGLLLVARRARRHR